MQNKSNQFFRKRQISGKKTGFRYMPSLTLGGYDMVNADFQMNDHVIVSYEVDKIIIRKAHTRRNCVILNEMKEENPDLQYLLDSLGLILI